MGRQRSVRDRILIMLIIIIHGDGLVLSSQQRHSLFVSLARKHRPQKFRDLVGQEPVCQALKHCLTRDDAPQTFLFSGIRGTGKTTLARLYAAAINCQHEQGFDACGAVGDSDYETNVCPSCRRCHNSHHEDIREIDGASHNSVEHIRELQATLLYAPRLSTKKVYIIDEVHMLSMSAFNALLKTLEEPPAYVVFILATTELHKLPATVVSRCQTFHLRRIGAATMLARFEAILQLENISYEPTALSLITEQAEGSLRDGLSILDQMVALGGGTITYATATTLMGFAPTTDFFPLWSALLGGRASELMSTLYELFHRGFEAQAIAEQLTKIAHKTSLVLTAGKNEAHFMSLGISDTELKQLAAAGGDDNLLPAEVRRFINHLGGLFNQFSGGTVDRYLLTNNLLEWLAARRADPAAGSHPADPTKSPQQPAPAARPPERASAQSEFTPAPAPAPASPTLVKPSQPPQTFPAAWADLLRQLERAKPIQARELSYAKVIEYSSRRLTLGIDSTTPSSRRLITSTDALGATLTELFNFKGQLTIIPLTEDHQHLAASVGENHDLLTQDLAKLKQTIAATAFHQTINTLFPGAKLAIKQPRHHPDC